MLTHKADGALSLYAAEVLTHRGKERKEEKKKPIELYLYLSFTAKEVKTVNELSRDGLKYFQNERGEGIGV